MQLKKVTSENVVKSIFPMLKKDRSIHIKVNLIRLTRWIVIQEVYSKKWILLNIGKQEEEML